MSAAERTENRVHAAFLAARHAKKELWPEPETSELWQVLYRAGKRILKSRDSRLLYYYGKRDIAGRIAERALLNLDKFDGKSRFSTWLYRIARNEIYDVVQEVRGRVETQLDLLPELEDAQGAAKLHIPDGVLDEAEERLVRLRIEHGYSFRELAAIFEMSIAGVHKRWKNAIGKLRSRLSN